MARSSLVTLGTHSDAIASGVTSLSVQNLGPGVAFVVLASSSPTGGAGNVGFRLHADKGLSISGLDGTLNVYIGAVMDDVSVEYTAITT